MAKFKEIQEKDENYICDHCKKTFKAKDIKLIEPAANIEMINPMMNFLFVAKDGTITGGCKSADKDKGDRLFACPYCGTAHLFGFDLSPKKEGE